MSRKTKADLAAENKELLDEILKLWGQLEEKDKQIAYDKRYIEKLRINFDEARKKYYDPSVRDKAQIADEMFETAMETEQEMQKQWRSDRGRMAVNKRYDEDRPKWMCDEAKKMFKGHREADPNASDWAIYRRMAVQMGQRKEQ